MKSVPILIVDDSASDRYLLTRDLARIGLGEHIFEASDGLEALEFLTDFDARRAEFGERFPPAVIFLDINMPRMNGFEFLEKLEELRKLRDDYATMVVLLFSSSAHPHEHQEALRREFVSDFLVKGAATSGELKEVVRRALAGAP